ncbi:MAG: phenylalanine--tRNA ligase subunit beta [Synergistaceae bacterium]|nr:phenylalanine--tRNA ligase subunit beta [Synergistaceae bacterium]
MKLSLNWIKKYVDLPKDLTMEKLSYDLTMCTVEVEDSIDLSESLGGLVVGKIITVEPHPDADKLRICTVDVGDMVPSTIVCGGINLAPGQLTIVAKPGAMVRWHGVGDPVEIKPAKLRGVMSYGMICSSGEIGLEELFPTSREAEIMDITKLGAEPGTSAADALGLNDIILEIDNKSLTNRPDLWGHYGMARELAAIYNCKLMPLEKAVLPTAGSGDLGIKIENPDRCPRYAAITFKNIKNIPSPFELRSMIWRIGMRSINLPVDITNYVMLATGQPTHGFDKNHIKGNIHVRTAKEGEKLELLDGEILDLTTSDLVIADEKNPVGLAGIMGGKLDSILQDTSEIILEIANFTAMGIRRTAQRFDLRTEASSRYEKSIEPQRVDDALAVAVNMFKEYFPESEIAGFVDSYPLPLKNSEVEVPLSFLSRRLGKELTAEEVIGILDNLGFKTEANDGMLHVTAPSWRSTGDISLPDDILEEVARLMGYENFDFIAPTIVLEKPINQRKVEMERSIREYLAFRCGMQEIFTYPWIEDEYIEASCADTNEMLCLSTPPSPDESRLRSTLIPGMMKGVFTNLRYFDSFRIFELTQVFSDKNYRSISDPIEKLPEIARHLGGAFVGADPRLLFRQAKGVLEYMHRAVHMEPLCFAQTTKPQWADDKLWLNVMYENEPIGSIGLISLKSARKAGMKRSMTVLFEIDVEKLVPLASRQNRYMHLPEYPCVNFDLSIVFDEKVTWAEIYAIASKVELVREVRFIDEYRGPQVGEGKKSVSFRTRISSDEGTLTSEKIEMITKQMMKKMSKKFGGDVRGA